MCLEEENINKEISLYREILENVDKIKEKIIGEYKNIIKNYGELIMRRTEIAMDEEIFAAERVQEKRSNIVLSFNKIGCIKLYPVPVTNAL